MKYFAMHVVHSCHMQATEPQEANAAQPCACQYFECSFAGASSLLNQNAASTITHRVCSRVCFEETTLFVLEAILIYLYGSSDRTACP